MTRIRKRECVRAFVRTIGCPGLEGDTRSLKLGSELEEKDIYTYQACMHMSRRLLSKYSTRAHGPAVVCINLNKFLNAGLMMYIFYLLDLGIYNICM